MAECTFCKTETELYEGGVPVCVHCSDARDSKRKPPASEHQIGILLNRDLQAATERVQAASAALDAVIHEIPSGLPHPDGIQRIHSASRELSLARIELMKAHNHLNDFLGLRIVPEGLKRGGVGS